MDWWSTLGALPVQITSIKVVGDEITHYQNHLAHPFPGPNSLLLCAKVYHGF